MRSRIIILLSASLVVVGLTSMKVVKEHSNAASLEVAVAPDSVGTWEVRRTVEEQLSARLAGKGGIEEEWGMMDKSGHRTKIFTNVDYNYKNVNAKKHYIMLSDKNEVFGDLVRIDGTLRSHICSFKIVYPEKKVYARRSVLDKWETVEDFTGVEETPVIRESHFDLKEDTKKTERKSKVEEPKKVKKTEKATISNGYN